MRHVIFAVLMILFVLYGGQNWHQYAAVIMVTAWVKHSGQLNARIW